jgi:hypothetical protein
MAIGCVTGIQFPAVEEIFTTVYKLPLFLEYRAFFSQWESNHSMKLTAHLRLFPWLINPSWVLSPRLVPHIKRHTLGYYHDACKTVSFPTLSCSNA